MFCCTLSTYNRRACRFQKADEAIRMGADSLLTLGMTYFTYLNYIARRLPSD